MISLNYPIRDYLVIENSRAGSKTLGSRSALRVNDNQKKLLKKNKKWLKCMLQKIKQSANGRLSPNLQLNNKMRAGGGRSTLSVHVLPLTHDSYQRPQAARLSSVWAPSRYSVHLAGRHHVSHTEERINQVQ
jgi:hypothetical protein